MNSFHDVIHQRVFIFLGALITVFITVKVLVIIEWSNFPPFEVNFLLAKPHGIVSIFGSCPVRIEGFLFLDRNARAAIDWVEGLTLFFKAHDLTRHEGHALASKLVEVVSEACKM